MDEHGNSSQKVMMPLEFLQQPIFTRKQTHWSDTRRSPNSIGNLFATIDPKENRYLRGRVGHAYSMSAVLAAEPLIQDIFDVSRRKLSNLVDRCGPVNMGSWAGYYTYDSVAQLVCIRALYSAPVICSFV